MSEDINVEITNNDISAEISQNTIEVTMQGGGGGGGSSEWGGITGDITDQADLITLLGDYALTSSLNIANWDTAYGWGNHALAGYVIAGEVPDYEEDPIYTSSSWYTTTNNSTNWNTAYGWGNHASAGYLTSYTEEDPVFIDWLQNIPNLSEFNNDVGYITGYTETDPVFSSWLSGSPLSGYVLYTGATQDLDLGINKLAFGGGNKNASISNGGINTLKISNSSGILALLDFVSGGGETWIFNSLYTGTVAVVGMDISEFNNDAGYLTSYTEIDPVFTAWLATPPDLSEFNNDANYITGTGSANRVAYWDGSSTLSYSDNLIFDGTILQLGTPTVPVATSDFTIGISDVNNSGLVIQTLEDQVAPIIQLQDFEGNSRLVFDPLGENSALRINYSGDTMATAGYAGFVLSLQNIGDSGEGSWLEILNSGGANTGAFFGMYSNQFQLFNWQGGDIEFNTFTSPSNSRVRFTITNNGNFGFSSAGEYAWTGGFGGGVGVIGIKDVTTAPTSSLTSASGLYSVSGELYFMSTSNTVRKIATLDKTETFTNKRITPRVSTVASSSTPTPNGDTTDMYTVTALAVGATFGAPTGTPTAGQQLIIRIKDNGTARSLAFNAIYRAIGVTLPTTTVISKTMYLFMRYNSVDTKWDVVDYKLQA